MALPVSPPPAPPPTRASWLVPLGLGVGGPLVGLLIAAVGLGYDLFLGGKMPHPLVIYGLAMLSAPFLSLSYFAYCSYRKKRDRPALPPPSDEIVRQLTEAGRRYTPELVEHFIANALVQLSRQADERYATHDRMTVRQIGQARQEGSDVDSR